MALTFWNLSGSPYGWRVWLALETKGVPYGIRWMSLDAGDFRRPDFAALNPRRRVPVVEEDGFVLWEAAAIVDWLEESRPHAPRLFSGDARARAVERRMVREADFWLAQAVEHLVQRVLFTPPERRDGAAIRAAWAAIRSEAEVWEGHLRGPFLAGPVTAADHAVFPLLALARRIAARHPGLVEGPPAGPRMTEWMAAMEALPEVQRTWPPHWR